MTYVKKLFLLVFNLYLLLSSSIVCDENDNDDDDSSDDGKLWVEAAKDDGNPYTDSKNYLECTKNYSNLHDVLNFVHTPIHLVPEHVFCAYLCMAESVALVLDGDIYPDRLILFPAKRETFNWTDYEDSKNCLKVLHCRIKTCMDFRDPMLCMSPNLLVDHSLEGAFNPITSTPDPYLRDVEFGDDDADEEFMIKD